jgi:hypothetical protein
MYAPKGRTSGVNSHRTVRRCGRTDRVQSQKSPLLKKIQDWVIRSKPQNRFSTCTAPSIHAMPHAQGTCTLLSSLLISMSQVAIFPLNSYGFFDLVIILSSAWAGSPLGDLRARKSKSKIGVSFVYVFFVYQRHTVIPNALHFAKRGVV